MDALTSVSITNKYLRQAIYRAHSGKCFYTSQPVPPEDAVIDHIMPSHCGGMDCIGNYVLTSHRLNVIKGRSYDADAVERMQYLNRVAFVPRVIRLYLKSVNGSIDTPQIAKREVAVESGRRGGYKRAAKLSAKRRTAIAKKAAEARWGKKGKK